MLFWQYKCLTPFWQWECLIHFLQCECLMHFYSVSACRVLFWQYKCLTHFWQCECLTHLTKERVPDAFYAFWECECVKTFRWNCPRHFCVSFRGLKSQSNFNVGSDQASILIFYFAPASIPGTDVAFNWRRKKKFQFLWTRMTSDKKRDFCSIIYFSKIDYQILCFCYNKKIVFSKS